MQYECHDVQLFRSARGVPAISRRAVSLPAALIHRASARALESRNAQSKHRPRRTQGIHTVKSKLNFGSKVSTSLALRQDLEPNITYDSVRSECRRNGGGNCQQKAVPIEAWIGEASLMLGPLQF